MKNRNAIRRRIAFTLIELLVVTAVIAVLIALLLPSLSRCREAAQRARTASNLHQIMVAYASYYTENGGAVLLGFTPNTINGVSVAVQDPASGLTLGPPVSSRYPWRMVVAEGLPWKLLYSHVDPPTIPLPTDPNKGLEAYLLSLTPSFGLNSIYVGGDNDSGINGSYQGFLSNGTPNAGHHVVFRAADVRVPANLIVFAETQVKYPAGLGNPGDPSPGYFRVNPPRTSGQSWSVQDGKIQVLAPPSIQTAIPQGRYGNRTVISFFDGHAESLLPTDLLDMHLWANDATSNDYDFNP